MRVFPEAAPPRRLSCFMLLLIRMSPMVKRLPTEEVMHDRSGPYCVQRMVPRQLAWSADPAGARLLRRGGARPRRGDFAPVSAAGLRRRGAAAEGAARRGRGREGFFAAGRRLRRELRGIPSEQHPRHVQGAAADGGSADLWRRLPGGQARPPRRPVRQTPLLGYRDAERPHVAVLSRRHHQQPRIRRQGARARPATHGSGLQPVRRHPQPVARLRPGRLRRSAPSARLEPGFRRRLATGRAVPGARRPADRDIGLHGGLRAQLGNDAADPRDRVLYVARGAVPLIRRGADPDRFDDRRLVRLLGASGVARRPHPSGRRGPCRVPARHQKSDRDEMRAEFGARRSVEADRPAQSRRTNRAG